MSRRNRDRAIIPDGPRPFHPTERNDALVQAITGNREGFAHLLILGPPIVWVSGRHLVGYSPVVDEHGEVQLDPRDPNQILMRRRRIRIPKGHPWRGRRPSAALYDEVTWWQRAWAEARRRRAAELDANVEFLAEIEYTRPDTD